MRHCRSRCEAGSLCNGLLPESVPIKLRSYDEMRVSPQTLATLGSTTSTLSSASVITFSRPHVLIIPNIAQNGVHMSVESGHDGKDGFDADLAGNFTTNAGADLRSRLFRSKLGIVYGG